MATPTAFQMVHFFADSNGRGWTEKYWLGSDLGHDGLQTLLGQLIPLRMALSTPTVAFSHARVQGTNPRQPYVLLPTGGVPIIGTYIGEQMQADVAVLFRLRSGTNQYNRVFMRGLPSTIVRGEDLVADATWDNAATAWINYIINQGAFIVRNRTAGVVPKPIVQMLPNSGKGVLLTVPTADPVQPVGTPLYISGAPIPGYNGTKNIVQDNGSGPTGHSYVLGGANPISTPTNIAAVRYKPLTYTQAGVANIDPEGIANRKVGRPFGLARGRARTLFNLRS